MLLKWRGSAPSVNANGRITHGRYWRNTGRMCRNREIFMNLQQMTFIDELDIDREKSPAYRGGFPCQPHSCAGKQLGEKDSRHLWPEFMRVVRELRPRTVVGENVPGILSTIHDSVCSDLEKEGYKVWTFCVPAYSVGAHHERFRVFIVAVDQSISRFQTHPKANPAGAQQKAWQHTCGRHWDYLPGTYWATHKPPVFGMVNGIPGGVDGRMRYKEKMTALGNAVCPQQAYPIFGAIAELEEIWND